MKFLKRLNLSYNQINEFWIFPENIEILLLNSNSISFCNDNLHNLKNLTTLDLSYNLLCDISSLSEIITLKYLFLKNNQISSSSPLQKLVNLYELDLESNVISEFSDLKNWDNHNSISILNMKGNPVIRYSYFYYNSILAI